MARLDDFIDYVSVYAPDADEDLLKFHIQEAITDFLIDTKLANGFHRFPMHDKVHDYVIDVPECQIILGVKSVRVGDPCTDTVDWQELKETAKRERTGYHSDIDNSGVPAVWIGEPCELSEVEVEYYYTVGRGMCEVPQFVYNKYAKVIQYRALSSLYAITGQEWSSPQLSVSYLQMYEKELVKIRRATRKVEGGRLVSKPFIRGKGSCFGCGGFFR